MTRNAAAIAGVFCDYKLVRTRSVVQIIVEVPVEQQAAVFAALGYPMPGQEINVAVARLVPQTVARDPEQQSRTPSLNPNNIISASGESISEEHPAAAPSIPGATPPGGGVSHSAGDEEPINPRGGPEPERIVQAVTETVLADAKGRTVGSIPATGANQRQRYAAMSPAEQAVTRAALLPKDERFRAWIHDGSSPHPVAESDAETYIRYLCCGGQSRKLIAEVPEYMDRFLAMETEFKMDVGEMARPR